MASKEADTILLTPYYGVVYFFSLLLLFENTVKRF